MKKIVSLMIAVMLLISCVPAAFAAGGSAGISSAEGLPGETVTVYVSYNVTDATDVQLEIGFGGLTAINTDVDGFTVPAADGFFAFGHIDASFATVALSGAKNASFSGSYAVQLAIPSDAVPGTVYTLSLNDGYIADENGEEGGSVYGGKVTVLAPATEPTTEPETTEPETTEPETTEPETTEPETTEPKPEPSTEPEGSDDEPKTGDITPHIVMAVASVIAVAAAAMFVFKRKAA